MATHCPKCDAELEVQEADPSVGIFSASAYCDACDVVVEVESEFFDDDVLITAPSRDRPIGTPISELSGQPGKPGYIEFARIARSWGHE